MSTGPRKYSFRYELDKCLSGFILKIVFSERRKYFIISLIILIIIDTSISLYVRLIKFKRFAG